jgi:FeS assembly protein IscX
MATEKPLKWTDVEDIAIGLSESRPGQDPLKVRFVDLHAWVMQLPGFADDPKKSSEKILEAIQMAWLEEYRDQQG